MQNETKSLGQMELRISIEEKNALIQCQAEVRYKYTHRNNTIDFTFFSKKGVVQ